jgi:alpha-beta hydrolase superfamily lysophospholipase
VRQREWQSEGCRQASIFGQAWLPEQAARSIVVISHGLGEHGGRYAGLASRLVDKGHAVYAIDHRGHGRSSGPRANIERFDYLVADLGAFVGRARREYPDVPVVLLGHSMGGAVALACAMKLQDDLRALVLSAPALAAGEALPAFKLWMVKLLSSLSPNTGALKLPPTAVSRDPEVVRAYESDPLVFHGAVPARTLAELLQAMQRLQQTAHELRIPVLVQHGTADLLVPLAAVYPTYRQLGVAQSRSLQVYEGLYHEVYNEPERDRVIGDLEAWLAL